MKTNIIGGAYQARSPNVSADRCINLIPEIKEDGSIAALYSSPGLDTYSTAANNGVGSGIYTASNGRCFSVNGAALYEEIAPVAPSTTPTMTNRGTITSGTVSSMTDNGLVMCIVNGTDGWYYTFSSDTLTQISDADFPNGCGTIGFLDGYFIACKPSTQTWYISSLYAISATDSWATLDFASAESQPDVNVGLIVDHRELWVFGETTTEGFSNTGGTFPIERMSGAVVQIGSAAQHSAAKLDNTIVWLGKSEEGQGIVYRLQGFTPTRISTHAVEFAIQGYSTISDARAFSYQQEGHHFYVLSFPTAQKTWVYDANSDLWQERAHFVDGEFTEWAVQGHAFFNGKHLTCSADSGKIYAINMDTHDNGTNINPLIGVYASKSLSVAAQDTTPSGLVFSVDGTKAYIVGVVNDTIYQYNLTTAFDISTGSYASKSLSVAAQDTNPTGFALSADGTIAYVVGSANDTIYQYNLTTAFDISTGSYASKSLSVAAESTTPVSLTLNADGTKAYIVGASTDTIYQYTLTTAWDISTGTYASKSLSVASQDTNPYSLAISTDGTKAYIVGVTQAIYQYTIFQDTKKYRKWLRAWRMPNTEGKDVIIPRLTIDCEVGQGLTTGQGSDPQIMLRISRDGGHTWSPTRSQTLGAKGNYKKRVFWDRNGHGRDVVFELSGSDPVRIAIKGAYLGQV